MGHFYAPVYNRKYPLLARRDVLKTIPGIGDITTQDLLALMPELGSLTRRQAAGLAPRANDCGKFQGYRRTDPGRESIKPILFLVSHGCEKLSFPSQNIL